MELIRQPQLKSFRVRLRPLVLGDFEALFEAASDPLIWEQHPEPLRYTRPGFTKYFDKIVSLGGALIIEDSQSGEVLGSSSLYEWDLEKKSVFIGYTFLKRSRWGGRAGESYNWEVKQLMLQYAAQFVERVYFQIGQNNQRSRRACEKIGGVFVEKRGESVLYSLALGR